MAKKNATTALSFSKGIDAWAKKTEARFTMVRNEAVKAWAARAQSRIPVATGFARSTIDASLSGFAPADRKAPSTKHGVRYSFSYDPAKINAVIDGATIKNTIYITWRANYAIYLEYGHSNQAPSGYVGITVLEWRQIVKEAVRKAKANAGAG